MQRTCAAAFVERWRRVYREPSGLWRKAGRSLLVRSAAIQAAVGRIDSEPTCGRNKSKVILGVRTMSSVSAREALYALAVMSGVLAYCPKHDAYYRGSVALEDAMPYYDRHLGEVRRFFASPVAFYTALKHAQSTHPDRFCARCTGAVGFV